MTSILVIFLLLFPVKLLWTYPVAPLDVSYTCLWLPSPLQMLRCIGSSLCLFAPTKALPPSDSHLSAPLQIRCCSGLLSSCHPESSFPTILLSPSLLSSIWVPGSRFPTPFLSLFFLLKYTVFFISKNFNPFASFVLPFWCLKSENVFVLPLHLHDLATWECFLSQFSPLFSDSQQKPSDYFSCVYNLFFLFGSF